MAQQSKINYTVVANSPYYEYFRNMAGAEEDLYKYASFSVYLNEINILDRLIAYLTYACIVFVRGVHLSQNIS